MREREREKERKRERERERERDGVIRDVYTFLSILTISRR